MKNFNNCQKTSSSFFSIPLLIKVQRTSPHHDLNCERMFFACQLLEASPIFYSCWTRSRSWLDRSFRCQTHELMFVTFSPSTNRFIYAPSPTDVWRMTLNFSPHWRKLKFCAKPFHSRFHLRPFHLDSKFRKQTQSTCFWYCSKIVNTTWQRMNGNGPLSDVRR